MFGIASVFLAAAFLRIYLIFRDSVPFAYDMGRDLLWSKDISFYGVPTLIGPAASIWGVYFPPFWFYFLSVPLRISGGHPLSAVAATAATIVLTGVLAYILFKKELTKLYALTLSVIILFSATLINISTFAFHANLLPVLTLGFIYFSYLAAAKNAFAAVPAFFLVSLMYSADPAPAVVMTFVAVSIFFYFKLYRSSNLKKLIAASFLAYIVPLSPNIIFEIRNNFVQTQALLAYARGENPSLSGQLPLIERIGNRADVYLEFLKTSFAGGNEFLAFLFLTAVVFGIYIFIKNSKNQNLLTLLKINLIAVIISFLTLSLVFTPEVKNWYLYGLTVPFAFLIALALYSQKSFALAPKGASSAYSQKGFALGPQSANWRTRTASFAYSQRSFAYNIRGKKIVLIFLLAYMLVNIFPFFKNQRINFAQSDPAQLSNQMAAIDYIYQDKKDSDFRVYTFTPSIYDHHYQYLFWWQGQRNGKGLPVDFAYLPNQPDYIRNKNLYQKEVQKPDLIYLIIENASENEFYTQKSWSENFQDFKLIWEKDINNAVTVQKRTR